MSGLDVSTSRNLIVVRSDLDALGYCARGSRRWFARMGLDWGDFVRDGIDAEIIEATGDAMALKLVEHIRVQHGQQ